MVAVCDRNAAALKRADSSLSRRSADHRLRRGAASRPTSTPWRSSRRSGRTSSWPRRRSRTASTSSSRSRSRRRRAGRTSSSSWRAEEPADHGGPHLPVQRRGPEDSRARRQRHARPAVLLRFDAGQPGTVSARRQRACGIWRRTICRSWTTSSASSRRRWSPPAGNHFNDLADMAFITVYFPGNVIAHINVNWLSPVKVRTTLIGGRDKMLVWNDLEPDEKIKVYDKGVEITNGQGVYDLLVSYRSGDVWGPKVDATEALKVELELFRRLHSRGQDAVERRRCRSARRPPARSRRAVAEGPRPARRAASLDRSHERLPRLLSLSARSGADRDTARALSTATVISSLATRLRSGASPADSRPRMPPILCRNVSDAVTVAEGRPCLPFDLSEVATNLRRGTIPAEWLQLAAEEHCRARPPGVSTIRFGRSWASAYASTCRRCT